MRIRPAAMGDVAAIAGLEAESFAEDAWPEGYLREAVEGLLHGTSILLAECDPAEQEPGEGAHPRPFAHGIVGYAITSTVFEIAELQRIAVTAGQRRRGIAGALLAAVRAEASAQGAERVLLEVRDANAGALAFYERAGFVEIDRRPRYYRDGATAIILQLLL